MLCMGVLRASSQSQSQSRARLGGQHMAGMSYSSPHDFMRQLDPAQTNLVVLLQSIRDKFFLRKTRPFQDEHGCWRVRAFMICKPLSHLREALSAQLREEISLSDESMPIWLYGDFPTPAHIQQKVWMDGCMDAWMHGWG